MPPQPPFALSRALTGRNRLIAVVVLAVTLCLTAFAVGSPSQARPDTRAAHGSDARSSAQKAVGLLPDSAPTSAQIDPDRDSVEVGVKFKSKVAGKVTGAQVYKIAKGAGTTPKRASLWNAAGDRLASAKLQRVKGSGWVSVRFSQPVAIATGKTYTVSVFAPSGRYAVTENAFTQREVRGSLVIPGPNNGVYAYGNTSQFPRQSHASSNYWVDVKFRAAGGKTPTPTPRPRRRRRPLRRRRPRASPTPPTPASLLGSP